MSEPAARPQAEAPRPPRRTQAERSASTRARLLDATVACLVELGYAGATIAEIEARAGVSRGARLHHFPSKAALVSAAMERLYDGVARDTLAALRGMGAPADFATGYRLLWGVHERPEQAAVLELLMAARTDPTLRDALREGMARQQRRARRAANDLFPDLATREADGLLETLQTTMLGLALRRAVFDDDPSEQRVLGLLERLVSEHFVQPTPRETGDET